MKRKSLFTLYICTSIIFFSNSIFGQNKNVVYVDEYNNVISLKKYVQKRNKSILTGVSLKKEGVPIQKLVFNHKFGKLDSTMNQQLRGWLEKSTHKNISKNQMIIINYRDTLYDTQSRINNYKKYLFSSLATVRNDTFLSNSVNYRNKKWVKRQKKCASKLKEKYNVIISHLYRYNYGSIKQYLDFNWVKDNGHFKKLFFKNSSVYYFLILKPDGEFFISGSHLLDSIIKRLLKSKNWDKYKADWKKIYNSPTLYSKGIFKSHFLKYEKPHCF